VPNPFAELIDSGRIADEAALKRAFRAAAKRIHPDVAAGADTATRAFITLKAEYEEALALLASKKAGASPGDRVAGAAASGGSDCSADGSLDGGAKAAPSRGARAGQGAPRPQAVPRPLSYSARAFYVSLEDLLGRGFPSEPARAAARASYLASREEVLGLLAGRDLFLPPGNAVEAFLAFEAGLSAIIAASKPNHPMEGRFAYYLRNLVANVLYYHSSGSPQPLGYARNEWSRLARELRARKELRPLAFLALLMADLEAGPACLDEEAGGGP